MAPGGPAAMGGKIQHTFASGLRVPAGDSDFTHDHPNQQLYLQRKPVPPLPVMVFDTWFLGIMPPQCSWFLD